jgi:hypothetical protein
VTILFQNLYSRRAETMLTIGQRDEFERQGIVRLPGAIARAYAEAMCNRVWQALGKRYGLRRESPATWKEQYLLGTHCLPKSENFPEIGSPPIRSALDDLFGSGNWKPPERWGSLLVTFPNSHDQWTVPYQAWHLDYPASSELKELSIVRIFVCLAKLEPCSGGTVFVAGSHEPTLSRPGLAVHRLCARHHRQARNPLVEVGAAKAPTTGPDESPGCRPDSPSGKGWRHGSSGIRLPRGVSSPPAHGLWDGRICVAALGSCLRLALK